MLVFLFLPEERVNIEQFRQQLWARHLIDPTYANFSASFSKLGEPHSYQSFQTKIVSVHYWASEHSTTWKYLCPFFREYSQEEHIFGSAVEITIFLWGRIFLSAWELNTWEIVTYLWNCDILVNLWHTCEFVTYLWNWTYLWICDLLVKFTLFYCDILLKLDILVKL